MVVVLMPEEAPGGPLLLSRDLDTQPGPTPDYRFGRTAGASFALGQAAALPAKEKSSTWGTALPSWTKDQQRVVAGWIRAPRTDWVAGAYFRELAFSNVNFRDGFREHAPNRTRSRTNRLQRTRRP